MFDSWHKGNELTANVEKVADTRVLEVQMARCTLVPAGMLAPNLCEIQVAVAILWYLFILCVCVWVECAEKRGKVSAHHREKKTIESI